MAVSAARAAAPSTPLPRRMAPRRAFDPPGAGSDGPSPNHTVTAVWSARSSPRRHRARSTRTAAGVSGPRAPGLPSAAGSSRRSAASAAARTVGWRTAPAAARASGPATLSTGGALVAIGDRIAAAAVPRTARTARSALLALPL